MNMDNHLPEPRDFDDETDEGYSDCPMCSRHYDEIDREYQSCSKCGWDAAENKPSGYKRKPTNDDYMNGDADILTGRWY